MLYHMSFNCHDTKAVAEGLAPMLGALAFRAPAPPFTEGCWFVCCGDDRATMIALEPWGVAYVPAEDRMTLTPHDVETPENSGVHGLFMSAVPEDELLALAEKAGWPAARVSNGPFDVINVWVEGRQLVEFTTPELIVNYQRVFDGEGLKTVVADMAHLEEATKAAIAAGAGAPPAG